MPEVDRHDHPVDEHDARPDARIFEHPPPGRFKRQRKTRLRMPSASKASVGGIELLRPAPGTPIIANRIGPEPERADRARQARRYLMPQQCACPGERFT